MTPAPKSVARGELYEQIWQRPAALVAKDYGVSGVAVAKACRRAGIPRPPRGYWAKLSAGKRMKRPGLPRIKEGQSETITFRPPSKKMTDPSPSQSSTLPTINMPDDLRGCHPLVSATRSALEAAKPDYKYERLYSRAEGILRLAVTKASLRRGLLIMEALIRAGEARGWEIRPSKDRGMEAVIAEDPVRFAMTEKVKRTEKPPDPTQTYSWKTYEFVPTSYLELKIDEYLGEGLRAVWSDGKIKRIEAVLPEFVVGLEAASVRLKERRLERLASQRRYAEAEQRRQDLERRVQLERARRSKLNRAAKDLQRAVAIRELVSALSKCADVEPQRFDNAMLQQWQTWANSVADRRDPFKNGYFESALVDPLREADLDCGSVDDESLREAFRPPWQYQR